jgi:hypothetical protein
VSWIADTVNSTNTVSTASYGTTVTFNWNAATVWKVTLTGDVRTSYIYNASSPTNFSDGDQIVLKIIQDSTGNHSFNLPSTVRAAPGYTVDKTASTVTTVFLIWRGGGWDFLCAPVSNPST